MEICNRLKQLRKQHALTQKDVADYLNISKSAYGYYEQGRNEMDVGTILKLAKLYQVSTDFLLCKIDIEASGLTETESEVLLLFRTLGQETQNILRGVLYSFAIQSSQSLKDLVLALNNNSKKSN